MKGNEPFRYKVRSFYPPSIIYFHSKDPSFHSWKSPIIRMTQNNIIMVFIDIDGDKIAGIGINKPISMSNTKKSTAKIKNRREKGIRADD